MAERYYDFRRYMDKSRMASLWHQLHEVNAVGSKTVLEIGPGIGFFKSMCALIDIKVTTLDYIDKTSPDIVGSVVDMNFESAFDAVCAFQVLEHMPYEDSLIAFRNMLRASRKHVIISLPDARPHRRFRLRIPHIGIIYFSRRPKFTPRAHKFDGSHHWEINKRGFELAKIQTDLERHAKLVRTYLVEENTYHRFFVFEKF